MRKGGGNRERKAGMEYIFYPPPLAGGGCERKAVAGGWRVGDDVWRFATPQKFADANFYPPPQAAEGGISCREIPAFAGMEERGGNGEKGAGMRKGGGNGERKAGMEYIFYPPPLAGGGASAKRSRGVESWR